MRLSHLALCVVIGATLYGTTDWPQKSAPRDAAAQPQQRAQVQSVAVDPNPQDTSQQEQSLVQSAKAFLGTLSDEQREQAQLEFDTDRRVQWHFIPMDTRKGLPVMEMQQGQKQSGFQLVRAAVSQLGYDQARTIMRLESVLAKLEGPGGRNERNPEKYYYTLFGQPAEGQQWGLSFEGHHLSLNFTMQGEKIVSSTPQFYATNPAQLKDDYGEGMPKGLEVLEAEEQLGFQLARSLSEEQLEQAELPGETPSEIRGAGTTQPPTEQLPGLAFSAMNPEQQALLKKLLTAYTSKMKQEVAESRWQAIQEAGLENIKFSWSGGMQPGQGHYYVIQGPSFLVEFINVQPDAAGNPANHIHCVWRDTQGDFNIPIDAS